MCELFQPMGKTEFSSIAKIRTNSVSWVRNMNYFSGVVVICDSINFKLNPLYTGRLFHCYMLDESICHLRGVRSTLWLYSIFDGKIC